MRTSARSLLPAAASTRPTVHHIVAASGPLGFVLQSSPGGGFARVIKIKNDSPMLGKLLVGDSIIGVDGDVVSHLSDIDVSSKFC